MLTVDEAFERLIDSATTIKDVEILPITQSLGRILANDCISSINVPPQDNSAMDGYAFAFNDVVNKKRLHVTHRVAAGQTGVALQPGQAARIFTGAPIPPGADTVIRQEWCELKGDELIFLKPVLRGDNVRYAGEDIKKGHVVLKAGTRIKAQHIGLAASIGLTHLPLVRRPKVALISTGNELVNPGTKLKQGQIYNSNRYLLLSLLEQFNCEVVDAGIVIDNKKQLTQTIVQLASQVDLILTTGGVSVGEEDHVKAAIEEVGQIQFWKIAVKPGKPLVYGYIQSEKQSTPLIGLPGNPVSAFVTFLIFVRPYILAMQNMTITSPKIQYIPCASTREKVDDRREFLRSKINQKGEVELFENQSSGVLSSLSWSDGFIDNPPNHPIKAGELVQFISFAELLR